MSPSIRRAVVDDIPAITRLIADSVMALMTEYPVEARRASIGALFGVDRQLIGDGTCYVVEDGGRLVGSGGWSFRKTLFGGDGAAGRDDARADPGRDAAHIRAFYVDPSAARTGIATLILERCEADAAAHGFTRLDMGATLAGKPFYARHGYRIVEEISYPLPGDLRVTIVHMEKALAS